MDKNIVTLSFAEESKAYQALSDLKRAAAEGRVQVEAAAVVARDSEGRFAVRDGISDGAPATAALAGTLIGSLVGILAGPLGVLLGSSTGALMGGAVGLDKAATRFSVIEQMMRTMPNGATVVIAQVQEAAPEVVDKLAHALSGVVSRRPSEAVLAEVEAQKEAQDAAAGEARKVLRKQQREEWLDKLDNWKDELGDKFEQLQKTLKDKLGGSGSKT